MIIGSYNHQIDAKNRFRIPTKFKSSLGDDLVLTKGSNKCLFLFSAAELDENIFQKSKQLSLFDETAQKSLRILLSSAHELETDNQGRSLIPANLKVHAEIEKDIVLIGVGNRVEIWSAKNWEEYNNNSNFDTEMRNLSNYGV